MSTGPLNPSKHLTRQGIDPKIVYAAVVVDNNDPRKHCRVKVRIAGIHTDAIPDAALPWALPTNQDYATDTETEQSAGHVDIPPIGGKVGVRFPKGDVYKPELAPYPGDKKTALPEAEKNYPFRKVHRYPNGACVIVDTKTNELFVLNPGDMHIVTYGDYTRTVVGSDTEIITGSKGDVPSYLSNASDLRLSKLKAKSEGGHKFQGSGGSGSKYIHVKGDYTLLIDGNRKVVVKGNDELNVQRSRTEDISGTHTINSTRSDTN